MTQISDQQQAETVFTYGAPQLKFGAGASDEVGYDLSQHGASRALVVTDAGFAATGLPQRVADQMGRFGIEAVVFDGAHVEPTDESMQQAIDFARDAGPFDAYVAVGGGSSIDTAKAVNLLMTNDGELMDYINVPVGKGASPGQAAQATRRRADHGRHRQREHHGLRARRAQPQGQDRDQPPAAASDDGGDRPRPHRHPAAGRHRLERHGHPVPRPGELHGAVVHHRTTRSSPSSGCPTAAPTRSRTCGRRRPCRCSARPSAARSGTATIARRATTWRWPRPSPAWASATPACTSRTPTAIRSPAGCATSTPRTTPPTSRWCRTACPSR